MDRYVYVDMKIITHIPDYSTPTVNSHIHWFAC